MNHLDLFSGIGGFSIGLERVGFKTVAFCEKDKYCQEVLKKHWSVPIIPDVNLVSAKDLPEISILTGGFPCQPFSTCGKRKGKSDDRYLWPAMLRVLRETRPTWFLGENVTGIIKLALDDVLSDLEKEGYATRTFIIPACAVNAPHRRDRVWILGYAEHNGLATTKVGRVNRKRKKGQTRQKKIQQFKRSSRQGKALSNTEPYGLQGIGEFKEGQRKSAEIEARCKTSGTHFQGRSNRSPWDVESGVCRVADGIPDRAYRLKALGNSVVPQIVEIIGRAIVESER